MAAFYFHKLTMRVFVRSQATTFLVSLLSTDVSFFWMHQKTDIECICGGNSTMNKCGLAGSPIKVGWPQKFGSHCLPKANTTFYCGHMCQNEQPYKDINFVATGQKRLVVQIEEKLKQSVSNISSNVWENLFHNSKAKMVKKNFYKNMMKK